MRARPVFLVRMNVKLFPCKNLGGVSYIYVFTALFGGNLHPNFSVPRGKSYVLAYEHICTHHDIYISSSEHTVHITLLRNSTHTVNVLMAFILASARLAQLHLVSVWLWASAHSNVAPGFPLHLTPRLQGRFISG